jgi:hypothetical protein
MKMFFQVRHPICLRRDKIRALTPRQVLFDRIYKEETSLFSPFRQPIECKESELTNTYDPDLFQSIYQKGSSDRTLG